MYAFYVYMDTLVDELVLLLVCVCVCVCVCGWGGESSLLPSLPQPLLSPSLTHPQRMDLLKRLEVAFSTANNVTGIDVAPQKIKTAVLSNPDSIEEK